MCTSTPFLFNPTKKLFLSYDDVTSTGIKAGYAKKMGLAGVVRPLSDFTSLTSLISSEVELL